MTYDATKPAGSRVITIETAEDGEYTVIPRTNVEHIVATNAFTAKGGDGFSVLETAYTAGRVTDLGLSDWENFRDYLVSQKDAIPTAVRGTLVEVKALTAADFATQKEIDGDIVIEDTAENLAEIDGLHVNGNVTILPTTDGALTIKNATITGDLNITAVEEATLDNVTVDGSIIR